MDLENELKKIKSKKIISNSLLNNLANELNDYIKKKDENNIFEECDIVFPNKNLIEWFKAYWLRNEKDVLMNINFLPLEESLLKYLDNSEPFSLVKRKEIRDLIIKYIVSTKKEDLDEQITTYVYDEKEINSIRLYDFANHLSNLFLDYEKDSLAFEGWQRKMYEKIMEDLFEKNITSLSYLYNKNKKFVERNSPIIFFGFSSLDPLYLELIKKLSENNNIIFYLLTPNDKITKNFHLLSAPSRKREIESLHSTICSLVKNKDYSFSDFLVLCPDTSKYENEIKKVFTQDGVNFPNIPFSINDMKLRESDVTAALKKLYEISHKGFFTRLDFSFLINNKIIKEARNISDEEILNYEKSIIEMNVFRDGKNIDDWSYAKKRLILSKVASLNSLDNNIVHLNDASYIPFSNIDFDDESILKFIKIIDDIHVWKDIFHNFKFVDMDNIKLIKEQLNNFFSIKSIDGSENNNILLKLLSEINFWVNYKLTDVPIPLDTFMYNLLDVSQEAKYSASELFFNGVTFLDYDEKSILSDKIIFFIGVNAKDLPKIEIKSEIDLRDLKNNYQEQYINFESQCANAGEGLYLSFINTDLKTDEELFPSSLLIKLCDKNNFELSKATVIKIDETRNWEDLYTNREYKEKDYYIGLFNQKGNKPINTSSPNVEILKKVTAGQMKDYLDEPLKYKFERLFGKIDDISDSLNDQYEPIKLDNLGKYILVKAVLLYLFNNPNVSLKDSNGKIDIELVKDIFDRFIIEHKIPNINDTILENNITNIVETAIKVKDDILKLVPINKCDIKKVKDVLFKLNNEDIAIINNDEFIFSDINGVRYYFELSNKDDTLKDNDYLKMYITSLMDVSSLSEKDKEYEINLYKGGKGSSSYKITPSKAKDILINIYKLMNSFENNYYMPINFLRLNKSFDDMVYDAKTDNGSWRYFKDRKMFDYDKDLGYTEKNYMDKISKIKKELLDLLLYIKIDNGKEKENDK